MYLPGVFLCLWVVLEGILNPIRDGKYCWYQMVVSLARRTQQLRLKLTINSPWETILLEIIATLWRENASRDQKNLSFLLELCSRSEMLSWSSVWIEFRSSSFTRIDVDESFKCRTEYRILKYEHVKKYALMEWRIKATENWLYIQHLVTWSFAVAGSAKQV